MNIFLLTVAERWICVGLVQEPNIIVLFPLPVENR